jgi:acetyltransferase-like isoleucine patch superfamily enzyme
MLKRLRKKGLSWIFNKKYKTKDRVRLLGPVICRAPNITFGHHVTLCAGIEIFGGGEITIGNNVAIGKDTIIYCHEKITIGDDTLIGAQAYIIDCDHGIKRNELIRKQEMVSNPVIIEEDVWIGAGAKILRGSILRKGTIIGAQGLVNSETAPYSINVGIPIRRISYRA